MDFFTELSDRASEMLVGGGRATGEALQWAQDGRRDNDQSPTEFAQDFEPSFRNWGQGVKTVAAPADEFQPPDQV